MARTWTSTDPRWAALTPYQRAAAMALMEADGMDPVAARNALGAMINRAAKEGVELGEHVSRPIYQPAIEPAQQARLDRILRSPAFQELTVWAARRAQGLEPDPVSGATHFLAPEATMLALERQNPAKYKNWGPRGANWTGYDPATGQYRNVVMRDASHAFLAPEGPYSGKSAPGRVNIAQNGAIGSGVKFGASGGDLPSPEPSGPLLAGLLQQPDASDAPSFQPVMDHLAKAGAAAIPEAPEPLATPQMRAPVDVSSLLKIISKRQRLGVA